MKSAGEMLVLKTNTQIQLYVCIKYGKVWCLLPGPFCQSQTLKLGEVWAGAVAAVGNRATCCAFYLTFGSVDLWIAYMRSCLKASNWCNPIRGTTSLPNTIEVTKDLLYSTASWLKWRKVKKLFIYFFFGNIGGNGWIWGKAEKFGTVIKNIYRIPFCRTKSLERELDILKYMDSILCVIIIKSFHPRLLLALGFRLLPF